MSIKSYYRSSEKIAEVTGLTISQVEGFANERLQQLQATLRNDH